MEKCKHDFITRFYQWELVGTPEFCVKVAERCEYCKEVILKFATT